jgi:hypothetical protein
MSKHACHTIFDALDTFFLSMSNSLHIFIAHLIDLNRIDHLFSHYFFKLLIVSMVYGCFLGDFLLIGFAVFNSY